jgi:hypothetical protein
MLCSWENTAASIKTVAVGLAVLLHHMQARPMQTRRMGVDAATCMHAQHSWVNSRCYATAEQLLVVWHSACLYNLPKPKVPV